MAVIESEELIELIIEGISATPRRSSEGLVERLVREIVSGQLIASSTSEETQLLAKAMLKYRPLILQTAIEKLIRCEVVSITAPICNAKSKIRNGVPFIVVFDGLFDTVVATIEMSYAVQELPNILDTSFPKTEFPDVSTKDWVGVIFSAFINRFLTHGESLPDFRALISSPSIQSYVEHAFLGAAWWTILHELGHIELGHTRLAEGQSRLTISDGLVIDEDISEFQHQEFEADAFVYDCLTDTGKQAFYAWTNFALGSEMMIETIVSKTTDTHPLTINRINRSYELSRGIDRMAAEIQAKEHLIRHGKAHLNIQSEHASMRARGSKPIFENWTRDELFTALHGLKSYFIDAGVQIETFINSTSKGWRSLFDN